MRNQTARAALAACLVAAAAAAQAPASEDTSRRTWDAPKRDEWTSPGAQAPQGEDYTLHRLFQEHHGDFMNRRERFTPQFEVGAKFLPNQRIFHEPGSFDQFGYHLNLDAPVLVSTDGYLKFGTYFDARHYTFSSSVGTRGNPNGTSPDPRLGDETLYAAGLKFGFGVFLDDNILFELETAPGAWSDLDGNLHHEDFDLPSHAKFTFRAMENLFFQVGARYNQVFEEAPWLPVLGINWEIVPGFRFDLELPEHLEFSFWPSAATGFLLGAEVTGAEYHVRTGLAQQQADANQGRANVRVQEVFGYLGLVHRFNDYTSISARAGVTMGGDYNLTTGSTGFDHVEGALTGGFYGDLSFGINF